MGLSLGAEIFQIWGYVCFSTENCNRHYISSVFPFHELYIYWAFELKSTVCINNNNVLVSNGNSGTAWYVVFVYSQICNMMLVQFH